MSIIFFYHRKKLFLIIRRPLKNQYLYCFAITTAERYHGAEWQGNGYIFVWKLPLWSGLTGFPAMKNQFVIVPVRCFKAGC